MDYSFSFIARTTTTLFFCLLFQGNIKLAAGSGFYVGNSSLFEDSGIKILMIRPQEENNVGFQDSITKFTGGKTDYYNVAPASRSENGSTPTLDLLLQYDCLMVHQMGGSEYNDATLLGDRLADYIDNGGGVVVLSDGFSGYGFTDSFKRGLRGRIIEEGYSPVSEAASATEGGSEYLKDGKTLLYEGIYDSNFSSIVNNRDQGVTLQGNGIQDGTYEDGSIAAAYRPDFRVVYLGGSYCVGAEFPAYNCPGNDETFGNHMPRWINACSIANTGVNVPSSPPAPPPPPTTTTMPSLSESDVLGILSKLYNETNGPKWINQNGWNDDEDTDFCTWFGLSCDNDGNIKAIYLEGNNLNGIIPKDIWKFNSLDRCFLGKNNIDIESFDGIEEALSLRALNIPSSSFKATEGIEYAPTLKYLDISNNTLLTNSTALTHHVFKLTPLETLNISGNDFNSDNSEPILPELTSLINLRHLYASYSEITETIPETISKLTNLTILDLTGNKLRGGLFEGGGGLNELPKLTELLLGNQQDNYGFPAGGLPSFKSLTQLRKLDLSGGSLSSTIPPDFLGGITDPQWPRTTIDLSCNSIHGTLPLELARFDYLEIDITGNFIEGIPTEFCSKDSWMRGNVASYGCDAIACAPGTCSEVGRQVSDETACSSVCDGDFYSTNVFGSRQCESYTLPPSPPSSQKSPAPTFIGCPCLNGGVCENEYKTGDPLCRCPIGFSGELCEVLITIGPSPPLTRPCTTKCFNGGVCKIDNSIQTCICPEGYTGFQCEVKTIPTASPTDMPIEPSSSLDGLDTVLLHVGEEISERDPPFCFEDAAVCLEQEGHGNLVLTKIDDSCTLWSSNYRDGLNIHVYSTKLQNKGVLLTSRRGSLRSVWKTEEKGEKNKDYVLVLSGNQEKLSIKLGDNVIWEADTNSCGNAPPTGPPASNEGIVLLRAKEEVEELQPRCLKATTKDIWRFEENLSICLEQNADGNVVVKKENQWNSCTLWASDYNGPTNRVYSTRLRKNGNLLTHMEGRSKSVWKTSMKGKSSDDYVLSLSDDHKKLSIQDHKRKLWEVDTKECELAPAVPSGEPIVTPGNEIVILRPRESISSSDDRVFVSEDTYLVQHRDGHLRIYILSYGIIWENGNLDGGDKKYYTKLQGDGNLVTRPGSRKNDPVKKSIWKSDSSGEKDDYYFVLSSDRKMVSIRKGQVSGTIIWSEKTNLA